jgi:hypothetical protein
MTMMALIRVLVVLVAFWLFYNGLTGSQFRGALPGSSKKGESIPTWLGKLGFFAAGLFALYIAFRRQ